MRSACAEFGRQVDDTHWLLWLRCKPTSMSTEKQQDAAQHMHNRMLMADF